jgi:outer membrane lipoprotein carrier protein
VTVSRRLHTATCCLLLVAASLALGDSSWVRLRQRYAGLKSLSGTFTETISATPDAAVFKGRFAIRLPNHYRLEVTEPVRQVIIGEDSVVWFHFPAEGRAVRQPAGSSIPLLAFLAPVMDSATDATVTTDSAGGNVVRFPDEELSALSGLVLELDRSRARITGFRFEDDLGNRYNFTLTSQQWNPRLPWSRFRFTPPAGTVVEYQ